MGNTRIGLPSEHSRLPRRSSNWRWFVVPFLAVVMAFAGRYILLLRAESRLRDVRASLPFELVSLAELPTLWGPAPSDEDNAAPIYEQAFARMPTSYTLSRGEKGSKPADAQRAADLRPELDELLLMWDLAGSRHGSDVGRPLPLRDIDRTRRFLDRFSEAFALRDQAVERPHFRESRDWSDLSQPSFSCPSFATLGRLTLMDCAVARQEGNWNRAWQDVRITLLMARHADQQGVFIQNAVAGMLRDLAGRQMVEMAHDRLPSAQMTAELRRLLDVDTRARLKAVLISECIISDAGFDLVFGRRARPLPTREMVVRLPQQAVLWFMDFRLKSIHADWLQSLDCCIRATDLPLPESLAELRALDDGLRGLRPTGTVQLKVSPLAERLYRCDATAHMLRVVLHLAEHRQAHGAYPETPEQLRNAGMLPLDPFSGAQFRYRPAGDGFLLWSVGLDGEDQGGRTAEELGCKDRNTGDIVFRVPPTAASGKESN